VVPSVSVSHAVALWQAIVTPLENRGRPQEETLWDFLYRKVSRTAQFVRFISFVMLKEEFRNLCLTPGNGVPIVSSKQIVPIPPRHGF
jgi:hypothetical protein